MEEFKNNGNLGENITFDKKGYVFIAEVGNGLVLESKWKCAEPLLWTPSNSRVTSGRVKVCASLTLGGKKMFRIYPLVSDLNKPRPDVRLISRNDGLFKASHTVVCLECDHFVITRPLVNVMERARFNVLNGNLDYSLISINNLLRHLFVINELDLEEHAGLLQFVDKCLDRANKMLARARSTTFEGERNNALRMAHSQLSSVCDKLTMHCMKILGRK